MSLSARQLAWASGHDKDADDKPHQLCRWERIEGDGGTLEWPELHMPYLWAYLNDLGLCGSGAMGAVPLSCAEIQAWSAGTGQQLTAWEFRALRAASRAYVVQTCSKDPQLPYGDADALQDPDVVDVKMSMLLDRLARPLVQRG